jgi:hypothetical protein
MNEDWEARFKPDERRPWPRWLLWLVIFLIPISFGPWWFRIAMLVVLVGVILLGIGSKSKPGSK